MGRGGLGGGAGHRKELPSSGTSLRSSWRGRGVKSSPGERPTQRPVQTGREDGHEAVQASEGRVLAGPGLPGRSRRTGLSGKVRAGGRAGMSIV